MARSCTAAACLFGPKQGRLHMADMAAVAMWQALVSSKYLGPSSRVTSVTKEEIKKGAGLMGDLAFYTLECAAAADHSRPRPGQPRPLADCRGGGAGFAGTT